MAEPNESERVKQLGADLAAAARDRGMQELEGAKGQLAEGAERVAAAVERTADALEGDGDGGDAVSGFGRSLAGMMRQLAGGLRERDIDQFASELGSLARRNPGVFLAGSVALGFGIARFFKARAPQSRSPQQGGWQSATSNSTAGESIAGEREDFDSDEALDLSGNSVGIKGNGEDERAAFEPDRDASSDDQADLAKRGGNTA